MTKIFCDFCGAEIINEPEGFVLKTVDKIMELTLKDAMNEDGGSNYRETTQIACRECKDKTNEFLKTIK